MGVEFQQMVAASRGAKLEAWFADLLRDPITKEAVQQIRTTNGVLDFRIGLSKTWQNGQMAYERWERIEATKDARYFARERASVEGIYKEIPLIGDVLDVGGLDGRIRVYMEAGQKYACVDPYPNAISDISEGLVAAYPPLREPKNFVCGVAEYLPIGDASFDTVHMRSVIDHLHDPFLGLKEAFRVLRPGGRVVIGISVIGGESGVMSRKERTREMLRSVLVRLGVNRYRDHHVWHPTFPSLRDLVIGVGFTLEKVHWQNPRVVYVAAKKT